MRDAEKRDYYQEYIDGRIELRDIPTNELNSKILTDVMKREPDKLIEFLLDLSEQRKINIELLKYIRMLPSQLALDEYYERYFELNPAKHYLKLLHSRRTMKMALRLMEIDPKNIEILLDKHKSKEVCDKAFSYDVSLIKYIPLEHITKEMCEKAMKTNSALLEYFPLEYRTKEMYDKYIKDKAASVRVSVIKAIANDWWKNKATFLGFLKNVPNEYISQETYDEMFQLNPLLFTAFPSKFKTDEMCKKIYELYGDDIIDFMPVNKKWKYAYKDEIDGKTEEEIKEFYYNQFRHHPVSKIDYIPLEYRTQKVYDLLFDFGGIQVVDKIPNEFRTQRMWDRAMFNAEEASELKEVPDKFITKEMCEYLYTMFGTQALYFIPERYLTKEMYIELIEDDIDTNLKRLPASILDEEVLSIIVVRLKKIISKGKTVTANPEVISVLVNLYPSLIKAFDKDEINEIVKKELYLITTNGGTIENIANKYGLSVSMISTILEGMKDTDNEAYDMIKSILEVNQNKYFFNMQNDVYNLDVIISLLNIDKTGKLDMMQKTKFAYLYLKYINNSLEEIYNFNYNKYADRDYFMVDNFFKRVLKYNYLFGTAKDVTTIPESKTIKFNNSWLRSYDRDRFFAIKDGKVTMERRYGKNGQLLTLEIEEEIVRELVNNEIPLNDMIVQGAFREYFNGNLDNYIGLFSEYDREFMMAKKDRRKK